MARSPVIAPALSSARLLIAVGEVLADDRVLAENLRAAADGALLRPWTQLLTATVARACERINLAVATKDVGASPLPVKRSEYLGIDVCAFRLGNGWQPLLAAIELENSERFDLIAYAMWKAASVRAPLGVLVCYRRDPEDVADLVARLGECVLSLVPAGEEFLLLVGTRVTAGDFPDGYFRPFLWDTEQRRFRARHQAPTRSIGIEAWGDQS